MSTKYYCDVCRGEFGRNQLAEIRVDHRDGKTVLYFDVCKPCREKMLEPVQEYHTTLMLKVPVEA